MEYQNEENVKNKIIRPALEKAGWDTQTQVEYEYFYNEGKIFIEGEGYRRGEKGKVDILLSLKRNFPIAIIETKNSSKAVSDGLQQAIKYAKHLDVKFVYTTNGKAFYEHDFITGEEKEIPLDNFPSTKELKQRLLAEENINKNDFDLMLTPYYFDMNKKITPRYYQRIAINRVVDAVIKGQEKILLVMATGSGKTFVAFQIVYRLREMGIKKKILYLADRNVLIDQTMIGDFEPLSKYMVKITNRKLDDSYEIYMALYQQLSKNGDISDIDNDIFKNFNKDFFDLIIIDECHRGSVRDNSNWKKILDYFDKATKIGLTATPRDDKDASNIDYFGKPIYIYSLKQGIEDGFLAPYRVIKTGFNIDSGWRPEFNKKDKNGNLIEDREYKLKDYNKNISIEERDKKIAKYITNYLKKTDRYQKTIVFCVDIEHARRMRELLIEENKDLCKIDSRYVMKITGDDKEGKAQLDNFIDINEKYPTIVTTSKLMTTGVDCKTCKVIALESDISSMTEFKQIIGRGTRVREDKNKAFFTIIDFRTNTDKFTDPEFDGETIIYNPKFDETTNNKEPKKLTNKKIETESKDKEQRYKPIVNGVKVRSIGNEIQYYNYDGKLITKNLDDDIKNNILKLYPTFNEFIQSWNSTSNKKDFISNLSNKVSLMAYLFIDKDIDFFDLIANVVYGKKLLTKKNRVENLINSGYLDKYPDYLKDILKNILNYYIENDSDDFKTVGILKLFGVDDAVGLVKKIGKENYFSIVNDLEKEIYKTE